MAEVAAPSRCLTVPAGRSSSCSCVVARAHLITIRILAQRMGERIHDDGRAAAGSDRDGGAFTSRRPFPRIRARGSGLAAALSSATFVACRELLQAFLNLVRTDPQSRLHCCRLEDARVSSGRITPAHGRAPAPADPNTRPSGERPESRCRRIVPAARTRQQTTAPAPAHSCDPQIFRPLSASADGTIRVRQISSRFP